MKKITIAIVISIIILYIINVSISAQALYSGTLKKVIIQEYNGGNAIFTNNEEMNEIYNLLRDANIKESNKQNIKIRPDLYVIEEYKNKSTITMGLSKNSAYIKYDVEGDIYWYEVNCEKSEEIYNKIREKLQSNIEANK